MASSTVRRNGRESHGRALAGRRLQSPEQAPGCHVLYLAPCGVSRLEEILASIADAPTLTLGETREFADRGRVIHLHRIAKRITFDINHAARVAQASDQLEAAPGRTGRPRLTHPPSHPRRSTESVSGAHEAVGLRQRVASHTCWFRGSPSGR